VEALKKEAGLEGDGFEIDGLERLLLWHAARQALPRISSFPVAMSVRARLEQYLPRLHEMKVPVNAGSCHFDRAA
jgi:hypothetical protein